MRPASWLLGFALAFGLVTPALAATADLDVSFSGVPDHIDSGSVSTVTAVYRNAGPDPADSVRLNANAGPDIDSLWTWRVFDTSCLANVGPGLACTFSNPVTAGTTVTARLTLHAGKRGRVSLNAGIDGVTSDPNSGNNQAHVTIRVNQLPESRIGERSSTLVRGTASDDTGVQRVQLGLRRSGSHCTWLANHTGAFVRRSVDARGRCRMVFLTAKGTRNWSFRLTKPLPAGKYVLYSRAIDRDGSAERRLTARNRVRMTVQ